MIKCGLSQEYITIINIIKKLKKRNSVISIDAENESDKIKYPFMVTSSKLKPEVGFSHLIHKIPQLTPYLIVKDQMLSPLDWKQGRMSAHITSTQYHTGGPSQYRKGGIKKIQIGKEKIYYL